MTTLTLTHLNKRFANKAALNDISLTLDGSGITALVGANGSGKTTLFSLIAGILLPSAGTVTINGKPPQHRSNIGKVAILAQDAQFHPQLNIGEQLRFLAELQGSSSKNAKTAAIEALAKVGLAERYKARIGELSHGMKKRVALAQTLLGKPELILLDEPIAGLDPDTAANINELIRELGKHHLVLLSSHQLDLVENLSQSVLRLSSGKLIAHQKIDELLSTDEVLRLRLDKPVTPELLEQLQTAQPNAALSLSEPQILHIRHPQEEDAIALTLLPLLHQAGLKVREMKQGEDISQKLRAGSDSAQKG